MMHDMSSLPSATACSSVRTTPSSKRTKDCEGRDERSSGAQKEAKSHLPHGLYNYLRNLSPIVLIHPFTAQYVDQRFRA